MLLCHPHCCAAVDCVPASLLAIAPRVRWKPAYAPPHLYRLEVTSEAFAGMPLVKRKSCAQGVVSWGECLATKGKGSKWSLRLKSWAGAG